jgi:hypothetical protein
MSSGLLISRKHKFQLSAAAANNPSEFNTSFYKNFRNLYNKILKAAKKKYFDDEFSKCRSNLKRTWDLIRNALNIDSSGRELISELTLHGITYDDPRLIAEKLNEFFVNEPKRISDSIPSSADYPTNFDVDNPADDPTDCPFNFNLSDSPVTRTEILEAFSQLESKKSEDLYGLSMFFIKKFKNTIVNPLYYIIFKSFETGKFPSQLKIAKVVPIHKGGDKSLPDNYRPISLLPNFSKIIEKIMSNRLTSYLENNNLISSNQFGFRKGHSTLHPIVHLINQISLSNNSNHYSIAIFCDLKKAFDTVDHKILLKKLYKLGVKGLAYEWFKDYLFQRKQFVSLKNVNSNLLCILLGVPQGSILGPLLFLIYINDLPDCNLLKNFFFADDTMLMDSHCDLNTLVVNVNREFQKVISFFRSNRLALHPDKTKFMLFTTKKNFQRPNIVFNFNEINATYTNPDLIQPMTFVNEQDTKYIRFLGVLIDPQLTFKDHVQKLSNKLSTSLYYMRSVRHLLNQKALKYIYFALFHSHLIYGIQAWSCTTESTLKPLILKQKQAIRIVTGSKYNAHTAPLFKQCNILPFPDLCHFFKLQFIQQFIQGFLPTSFNNTWISNRMRRADQGQVELRNDNVLAVPFSRNLTISRMPIFSFPKLWSEFPSEQIKILRNKLDFNWELKKYFLSLLSETSNCNRLFCPTCHNIGT